MQARRVITIGRQAGSDVVVNDEHVSRMHVQLIEDEEGSLWAVDLNSTNGTFVNGQRIYGAVQLHQGDQLQIGETLIPWWNYVGAVPAPPDIPMDNMTETPPPQPSTSPNRLWLYIAIAAAVLLLAGGGVLWKVLSDKHKAAEAAKTEQYREMEREQLQISEAAAKARSDYEMARRKAAETKSEEDMRTVKELRNNVAKYVKDSVEMDKKIKAMAKEKSQSDTKQAEEITRLQGELTSANTARETAERQKEETETKLTTELNNVKKERDLTRDFYVSMKLADKVALENICGELGLNPDKKPEFMYNAIVNKFNSAGSNAERQRIVTTVTKAVSSSQQKGSKNKKVEEDNSDNVSTTTEQQNTKEEEL